VIFNRPTHKKNNHASAMQLPTTKEYIKHNYVMLKEVWVPVFVKSVYYNNDD